MRTTHPQGHDHAHHHHPALDHDSARQGVTGHHVRHVLGLSLALAFVLMVMALITGGF